MSDSSLTSITNQLLGEYDLKFNENYNDIVQLNSSIQNKEELILKTNEVILYKERNIIILQYFLYFTIAFFLCTFLYSTKDMKFNHYITILIVLFIVLAIACYIHIAKQFSYFTISRKIEALKVAMVNYSKKLLENKVPKYECPTQCSTKEDDDNADNNDGSGDWKYKNNSEMLKIDPTLNVWKHGDVPSGSALDYADSISDEDNPQPIFGTTHPKNTYYECKWLGNTSGKNMPKNMRAPRKKYSSIPCDYRPNNTEVKRWFCEEDPNNLSADEVKERCQEAN